MATRTLLVVFAVAVHNDFAARFRWVCRCSIQVADDPNKFVDRMNVAPPLPPPSGLPPCGKRSGPEGGEA